jgi:hypothetical protein
VIGFEMASRQIQINALIDAIARAISRGGNAEAAATATGLRRAVWAMLTEGQQARVLAAARRRARVSEARNVRN